MTLNHDGSTSGHVDSVTNDQFQQLLSAISSTQQKMEDRLCSFRQELVSSQEESTVKALKRARYDKALTFRKKGNEEQHKFNERLGTELENVTIVYLEHKSNFRFYLVICIRVFIKTAKINPRQIQGLTKTLKLVHANNSVLKVDLNPVCVWTIHTYRVKKVDGNSMFLNFMRLVLARLVDYKEEKSELILLLCHIMIVAVSGGKSELSNWTS